MVGKKTSSSAWLSGLADLPVLVTLALLAALVVAVAASSLGWRIYHDAPILSYIGFMIERFGAVPYRDLFDMNLPLTDLAFALIGHVVGYSDLALRSVDLFLLAAALGAMAWAARPFGWRVAIGAPLLYAALYLHEAPLHGLQRESMIAIPLAVTLALLRPGATGSIEWRAACAGALVGIAAAIKPTMAIDLAPVVAYMIWLARHHRRPAAAIGGLTVAGFALPLLATWIYLVATGAWASFLDIFTRYLPLYARLGGVHETISDADRFGYLARGWWGMGGYRWWWLPAVAGLVLAFRSREPRSIERGFVVLVLGLLIAHSLAPAITGQFWPYHWYPFLLSVAVAVALCWSTVESRVPRLLRFGPPALAVIAAMLWVRPPAALGFQLSGTVDSPLRSRIDDISTYLSDRLRPGDTVQPLDWTGGAVHAMLIARARLATPFLYDFHFYHHVSTPYIQELRRRFLDRLERAAPRFVIRIETEKPWVQGEDTTREFPELERYLVAHYGIGLAGPGYEVLERRR